MKLNEQGKQTHMGCYLTPQELHHKLKQGPTKKWEEKFRATTKPECGGLCARVQAVQYCDECQQPLQMLHQPQVLWSSTGQGSSTAREPSSQPKHARASAQQGGG